MTFPAGNKIYRILPIRLEGITYYFYWLEEITYYELGLPFDHCMACLSSFDDPPV